MRILGTSGNDLLSGQMSDDTIRGFEGNDTLDGNDGNDALFGDDGEDYLRGGTGLDILSGGNGNDILRDRGIVDQVDTLQGGAGDDTLNSSLGLNVPYAALDGDTYFGGDGIDTAYFALGGIEGFSPFYDTGVSFVFKNITTGIVHSAGGVIKQIERIRFTGGAGNDVVDVPAAEVASINGYLGDDRIITGAGNDTLNGSSGNDFLEGNAGNDTLIASDDSNVPGDLDADTLNGSSGNDSLEGGSGADTLNGGDDNDTLKGGSGVDNLDGAGGNDYFQEFQYAQPGIKDTLSGGTGIDTLEMSFTTAAAVNYTNVSTGTFNGGGVLNNIEKLVLFGSSEGDLVNAAAVESARSSGNEGNDTLSTNLGLIAPNMGFDFLDGGDGDDRLTSGGGNDTLIGASGNDTLAGGKDDDSYDALGNELIVENANEGIDQVRVIANIDYTLTNNVENLSLLSRDNINGTGNSLDNRIDALSGNNILDGSLGSDRLNSGGGNDTVIGGEGIDYLSGGGGNDSLIGGTDIDRFFFGFTSADVFTKRGGVDTITDFDPSQDLIVLRKVAFTNLNSTVNRPLAANEFTSINTDAAAERTEAGLSTAKIVYNLGTGNLFHNSDGATSGLGSGEQFATLTGIPTLDSNDFIVRA
jgi:Ca2+-binding RTX toxin-like protein